MPRCIGRTVSDTIDRGKIAFFHEEPLKTKRYYHIAIQCDRTSKKDSLLCEDCQKKKSKLDSNTLTSKRISVDHPSVLHGTIHDPIPTWSHIEGGEWFKNMLVKGYSVEEGEMGKKNFPEEKIVFTYIDSLKDKSKASLIKELIKKYPVFTKTSANRYLISYNKRSSPKENIIITKTNESKTFVVNDSLKNEYEIVKIKLVPLKEFFYNTDTCEVYDSKCKYLGLYDKEKDTIDFQRTLS
jgi:hypothetical protein